ncbi:hypothetical protein F443_22737 [Phytophthora nicotianae P1569]|uniref:Retrotransposon gag domain-containing protein n=1 Tax=Phytophthora nicotianae P1569 TaxID=1317065 RepID=V9DTB0_PHYNI|nr:hypothetical protein F443_22737 [Phytophthora nicotianae P1569]
MEASSEAGSPTTLLNEEGSTEGQSAGRSSADRNEEEDLLEEKLQSPPYTSSKGTADHDVNHDPPGEEPKVKTEGTPPTTTPLTQKPLKKKKQKTSRKKLKAPTDSDSDSREEIAATWSDDQLEEAYDRNELQVFLVKNPVMKILQLRTPGSLKGPVTPPPATANKLDAVKAVLRLLKEAGITPGPFAAKDLFHLDLEAIQTTLSEPFEKLKVLVGEAEIQTKVETKREAPRTQLPGSVSPTGSSQHSHYASSTSMADSDTSEGVGQMQSRGSCGGQQSKRKSRQTADVLQIGDRALLEGATRRTGDANSAPDEKNGAAGRRHGVCGSDHGEYDPDDLDLSASRQATVATAATTTVVITPRIRVSAISEVQELSGKDDDEDRAQAWIGKVKSAFVRDQTPDDDQTTRGDWKEILREFQVQFCGLGVSVARQYYHARKRANETPLEFLHRLNITGLRAKLRVKGGPSDVRRKHVEHFFETLDDHNLADQLALLLIADADALEEVLRARQRAKNRQGRAHFGFRSLLAHSHHECHCICW